MIKNSLNVMNTLPVHLLVASIAMLTSCSSKSEDGKNNSIEGEGKSMTDIRRASKYSGLLVAYLSNSSSKKYK
jgi:hypothetical protein